MAYSIPLSAISLNSSGQLVFNVPISSGAVTSVAASVPAFLSISGSPITSSGTLAISLSGTALPIANGGTNSITALSNGKIISSVSGSIVESSISTSNVFLADGTVSATGAFSLGNNQVHNVADPTSAQDSATKNYVDNAVNGLDWKQAALLATTTALPTYTYTTGVITMVATGTVSVDGSVLALGNRILVKNETSTNQPYNGIYNVTTAGAVGVACVLTRSSDYNSVADIQPGDAVYIQTGTVNITTSWVQTQTITSVGGAGQNIIFVQSSGPGTIVINGTTNQIIANTVGTTTTLSTPQDIATTSTPTFGGLTVNTAFITIGSSSPGITGTSSYSIVSGGVLQLAAASIAFSGPVDAAGHNITSLAAPSTSGDALSWGNIGNLTTLSLTNQLTVANGGTGDTSFTAYSVITGGTTSTGALQSVSGVGTFGQVLTSNGASALPTWQTISSGSGTVNSGTTGELAYYASSGTAISGNPGVTSDGSTSLTVGQGGTGTNVALIVLNSGSSGSTAGEIRFENNGSISHGSIFGGTAGIRLDSSINAPVILAVNGSNMLQVSATGVLIENGNLSFTNTSTQGIVGTTTNDSAAAGNVGEFVSSGVSKGSAVSISTGTPITITSISLTAGDWDVTVQGGFVSTNASTSFTEPFLWIGRTNNSNPGSSVVANQNANGEISSDHALALGTPGTGNIVMGFPVMSRVSLSSTTTIYFGVQIAFTNTATAFGSITARRRR